jgi:hypothetical protein
MNANQAARLIDIVTDLATRLEELSQAMARQREAFVSARPSDLERVAEGFLPKAEAIAALEKQRASVVDELCRALGLDAAARISAIAARLSSELGGRLRAAGVRAAEAARLVRIEATVGARLLNVSAHAQEGLYRELLQLVEPPARGYDRSARATGTTVPGGRLVSGKV